MSRSLTRLEKHLGLLLVRRGQRGLLLTDAGSEYLNSSVEALHTLRNAGEFLDRNRSHPRGVLRVACPITMARDVMGPLMRRFFDAQPELRVDIQPYSSLWDQEPKEDIDIFFKIRAPRDSLRRVQHYPSAKRALYASRSYVRKYGLPNDPAELSNHRCTGSADDAFYANWKLTKGGKTVALDLIFQGWHEQRLRIRTRNLCPVHRENAAIMTPERIQTVEKSEDADGQENGYLLNMREGFKAALAGMYAVAQRQKAA